MSKTIKQILLKVDLFTPHFEYEIENQQTRFATKSGGVFTLMICCIAVAFTSVRINDWLKGQLETSSYNYYFLPKDNFTTNLN